jgi:hypothetical protein
MDTESTQVSRPPKRRPSKFAQRYEQDYHAWLIFQAGALREERLREIDAPNLAEELEDMARSANKTVKSQAGSSHGASSQMVHPKESPHRQPCRREPMACVHSQRQRGEQRGREP